MIGARRVLGLIPARGGSKGVPRKNLRPLAGKALLQWTVEAARGSRYIDRLVLSTDDDEIAALGAALGVDVPFRRAASASSDEAGASAVIEDAVAQLDDPFDYLVYLQPTSPLRTADDIDGCLEKLETPGVDACVSVSESPAKLEWLFYVESDGRLESVLGSPSAGRRQDLRPAFLLNGAVYACRLDAYLRAGTFLTDRTLALVMPAERGLDLDEESDFAKAEALLAQGPRDRIP